MGKYSQAICGNVGWTEASFVRRTIGGIYLL